MLCEAIRTMAPAAPFLFWRKPSEYSVELANVLRPINLILVYFLLLWWGENMFLETEIFILSFIHTPDHRRTSMQYWRSETLLTGETDRH
jgi:hypothetical protein